MSLPFVAFAVLAPTFIFGSTPDEEEFRFSILSTVQHARVFVAGDLLLWNPLLGLGMPHPLGLSIALHPLMPLGAWLPPDTWARALYIVQTAVGAWGMLRLTRTIGLSPWIRGVCTMTFLLATPLQNYALSEFWPSFALGWTLMPWLVYAVVCLLTTDSRRHAWALGILIGVVAGLLGGNGYPGYVPVWVPALLGFLAADVHGVRRHPGSWLIAAIVALAIAAPMLLRLVDESQRFDPSLARFAWRDIPKRTFLWDAFLRPLAPPGEHWIDYTHARGNRLLFFGGPFTVLSLIAMAQRHGRVATGCKFAVTIALALLVVPGLELQLLPHRFLQRDPLIFFAIPLAGLALERLRHRSQSWVWSSVVVMQVLVLVTAAAIFARRTVSQEVMRVAPYSGATSQRPFADHLLATLGGGRVRLVLSPMVDELYNQRGLLIDGLGINALAYRDISIVNGSFKGVATDTLQPSPLMFYGRIALQPAAVQSRPMLTVLGVTHVLAFEGEHVADELRPIATLPSGIGRNYVLWRLDAAWPGAAVLEANALDATPKWLAGCGHDRLVCRDLSSVEQARIGEPTVARRVNALDVRFSPAADERVLLVSEMYRPGWTASSAGQLLRTWQALDALIAVDLPPDAHHVMLEYRDPRLVASWAVAYGLLVAIAIGIFMFWFRTSRRRRQRPGP